MHILLETQHNEIPHRKSKLNKLLLVSNLSMSGVEGVRWVLNIDDLILAMMKMLICLLTEIL
jgi:hypothetical protein